MVIGKRPTIHDIAREAHVSVSAVSHAFNRPEELSPDLRERIIRLAEERGYRPDPRARGLRRGESSLIALVVSNLANVYFAAIASAVQQVITEHGYHLVVLDSGTREGERRSLEAVRHEHMAGVIVDAYYLPAAEVQSHVGECPVVLVVDADADYEGSCVRVPNVMAAYTATAYLAESGRKRIAHIAGPLDVPPGLQRRAGYRRALEDAGLGPPLEVAGDFSFAGGKRAMDELLAASPLPDAVFAANDLSALGALMALRAQDVAAPEQVAVVGIDNIEEAEWSVPSLTTVTQPAKEIGSAAATLLLTALRKQDTHTVTDVACTLVKRCSA